MDNKLNCAVVMDLLPSYAEGLTSEETGEAVREHLSTCEVCRAAYERMKEPPNEAAQPAPEVDYLKKVRIRSKRASLIIGIALMIVGMALVLFRVFYVGSGYDAYGAVQSVEVNGCDVTVNGTLSSGSAVARVTFSDSNGMVQAHVYTAPKAFFNSTDFSASYTAASPVAQVRMGSLIVWEEGTLIGPTASRLFAAVNPFVGDMPANANIASILGVGDQFGPYTNELQTTTEPYGWTLILEEPISAGDESAARDIMAADSYAMLAVIENLGSVSWKYTVGGAARELTITAEDASIFAGYDIKYFGKSASSLQALMRTLGMKWAGVREVFGAEDEFRISIRNACEGDVYGLYMDYYLDGKMIGGRGTVFADGSPFKKGEETVFEFLSQDLPAGVSAIGLSSFSFDLYALDAEGNETLVQKGISVPAKYAWTFSYTLFDDANGYTLNEG